MSRPAQAIIDLAALRHNYQLAQRLAPNTQTLAVVKANAYGHGAVEAARALEPLAPVLAVACIEEAVELRAAGIHKPILLLEGAFEACELVTASEEGFWLMVSGAGQLEMLAEAKLAAPVTVWLKADSGMHRLGFVGAELRQAYERLQQLGHVCDEIVLATHFACADELERDVTQRQMDEFTAMAAGIDAPCSLANSAAVLGWPATHSAYNRPGIMLYGSSPFAEPHPAADQLQAVMSLISTVIGVRTVEAGESVGYGGGWTAERRSVIATIAMGYGDGYPRMTPNGTPVLVNGQRCPLAGRVSMDMITVDVTDLEAVQLGDAVELWGKNLSLNEVATCVGTIGYELVTRMPLRTPRVYING